MITRKSARFLALFVLATAPLHAQAIVGSWFIRDAGESKGDAVLTFLANGTYLMAEDGNRTLDPSGKDGMERGTYTWNPKTNAFSSKTLVDTTGEWGLSDGSIRKISVSGNTLTLAGLKLKRITSATNTLVGTWYLKEGRGYAAVTFLTSGEYFMVQDGKAGFGGKTGVERGTYQWNPTTKAFTSKVRLDTNGTWGFSDNHKRTITLSGNRLTMKVSGEGKFTLSRVVAP